MNKLTELKKLRNNTYLATFEIEGKVKTNVLSEETIIAFNLLSLREVTKAEYKKIVNQNDDNILYEKAVHFIDYQMRSISEVKKHLKKTTKDEKKINAIIKKLKDQQYLDDNHFAKEYCTQKMEFDVVGPKAIKEKLIQKGVHYDIIDAHLIKFSDDMQFDKINQIIQKEIKFPIKKPYKKAYVSLKTKLISKGFSLRIVEAALSSSSDLIKEVCLEDQLLKNEVDKMLKQYDKTDFKQKEKMISKLLQKGYDYSLIKKYLS